MNMRDGTPLYLPYSTSRGNSTAALLPAALARAYGRDATTWFITAASRRSITRLSRCVFRTLNALPALRAPSV